MGHGAGATKLTIALSLFIRAAIASTLGRRERGVADTHLEEAVGARPVDDRSIEALEEGRDVAGAGIGRGSSAA